MIRRLKGQGKLCRSIVQTLTAISLSRPQGDEISFRGHAQSLFLQDMSLVAREDYTLPIEA